MLLRILSDGCIMTAMNVTAETLRNQQYNINGSQILNAYKDLAEIHAAHDAFNGDAMNLRMNIGGMLLNEDGTLPTLQSAEEAPAELVEQVGLACISLLLLEAKVGQAQRNRSAATKAIRDLIYEGTGRPVTLTSNSGTPFIEYAKHSTEHHDHITRKMVSEAHGFLGTTAGIESGWLWVYTKKKSTGFMGATPLYRVPVIGHDLEPQISIAIG
jgi:hypothetical protein